MTLKKSIVQGFVMGLRNIVAAGLSMPVAHYQTTLRTTGPYLHDQNSSPQRSKIIPHPQTAHQVHRKKFADLLEESNLPFLSPYDSMTAPHFTSPSFHGPLSNTTPKQKTETTLKTVVNLSDAQLSPTELEFLNLGLKFVPTPKQDLTPQLAPLIQNIVKRLPNGMESSAIHQTTTILADYNPKQDKTPDNLTSKQRAALKFLMKKRSQLIFLPADKGNATVILNDQQYIDKVEEHIESSGCYTILNKDPNTPIHDKLYRILLKFKKEGKINSETMRNMRQLHPRWPQLYGQPKIHKLGAPIRPVVSFYNTPLSRVLHCPPP